MNLATILGWTATTLFTVCYIPQLIKTLKTKTVSGLSMWLLIISLVANVIALKYAFLIQQKPLEIKYTLGIIFTAICLAAYWKVSKRK